MTWQEKEAQELADFTMPYVVGFFVVALVVWFWTRALWQLVSAWSCRRRGPGRGSGPPP